MDACSALLTTHSAPSVRCRAIWDTCFEGPLLEPAAPIKSGQANPQSASRCNVKPFTNQVRRCQFRSHTQILPEYGTMICSKNRNFASICTINCDSGYDLIGPRQRACGAEGRWSGLPPTCELIHCGPTTSPQHGNVTCSMFEPN